MRKHLLSYDLHMYVHTLNIMEHNIIEVCHRPAKRGNNNIWISNIVIRALSQYCNWSCTFHLNTLVPLASTYIAV